MKKVILTLVLGVAAAASAQTTGDRRCTDSPAGKHWMAVTQNSGYCTSPPAQTSASAQPSNWLDAACPNKEPEEAWRQCVMAAVSAKGEARENTSNEQVAQQKLLQQQAEYQQQFQQQVELTRRQMVLNALHAAYASGARTRISEQSD